MNAALALEVCILRYIKMNHCDRTSFINSKPTLHNKLEFLKSNYGRPLPTGDWKIKIVDLRNNVLHGNIVGPSEKEVNDMLRDVECYLHIFSDGYLET